MVHRHRVTRTSRILVIFFFNDTATTEIYTLSLHDALPISTSTVTTRSPTTRPTGTSGSPTSRRARNGASARTGTRGARATRSEEHTSELQSRQYLVCRLLLEKKKKITTLSIFCKLYAIHVS